MKLKEINLFFYFQKEAEKDRREFIFDVGLQKVEVTHFRHSEDYFRFNDS